MSLARPGATLARLSISDWVADSPTGPSTDTSASSAGKIESTPGGAEGHGRHAALRGVAPRAGRSLGAFGEGAVERVARGEVAIQRRAPDAGGGGHLDHADAPVAGQRRRGSQDPRPSARTPATTAARRRTTGAPPARRGGPAAAPARGVCG